MTVEKLQICQQWVHIVVLIFRSPFVNPTGALTSNDNQLVEINSYQLVVTKSENFSSPSNRNFFITKNTLVWYIKTISNLKFQKKYFHFMSFQSASFKLVQT